MTVVPFARGQDFVISLLLAWLQIKHAATAGLPHGRFPCSFPLLKFLALDNPLPWAVVDVASSLTSHWLSIFKKWSSNLFHYFSENSKHLQHLWLQWHIDLTKFNCQLFFDKIPQWWGKLMAAIGTESGKTIDTLLGKIWNFPPTSIHKFLS